MGLLDGRVVAISGAGRGLGRAYARACATAGAKVVVNDCGVSPDGSASADGEVARAVAAALRDNGAAAVTSTASVADDDGARELVQTAVEAFGRLDVLVNNAGTLQDRPLSEMTLSAWDAVVDVHLRGSFACSRYAALQMIDQGDGGRIINTTSMAGLIGNPGQVNYAAAKGGIVGMTRTAALELARVGITVNAIAPLAKTRLTAGIASIRESARPELVAPLVVFLASQLSKDVTGRIFGMHQNHLFEYRVEMTGGVDRGDRPWEPEEIGSRLAEVGRSEAERLRSMVAAGGCSSGGEPGQASLGLRVFSAILSGFRPRRAGDWSAVMHFQVQDVGAYTLRVSDGSATVELGLRGEPTCAVAMDGETFFGMATGAIEGEEAFMDGRLGASNMSDLVQYAAVIHQGRARAAVAEVLAAAERAEPTEPG